MIVHLRIPATRQYPRVDKIVEAEDEWHLWTLAAEHIPGRSVYVSGTGAVVETEGLRIVGRVEPIDDEARAVYRPLVAVRRVG